MDWPTALVIIVGLLCVTAIVSGRGGKGGGTQPPNPPPAPSGRANPPDPPLPNRWQNRDTES